MSDAFAELADRAAAAGWSDEEVAAAHAALADNRMLGLVQIDSLEVLLVYVKQLWDGPLDRRALQLSLASGCSVGP